MTRLFAFRFSWLPLLLGLFGCQHFGQNGTLQAENPVTVNSVFATPPSQRRPLAQPTTSTSLKQEYITPNSRATAANSNSIKTLNLSNRPPALPGASERLPNPDLPSLRHLLNRSPKPMDELLVGPALPPAASMDTVRAALLLPLSGSNAAIGQEMMKSAQLAVFDFADYRFELLPIDTNGTSKGAGAAATKAIADGAGIILGPLLSNSVRAAAPAARAANVPMLAFSSDRRVAGDGIYTLGFLPEEQVWRIVSFAVSRGIKNFAALAPDNFYGSTVLETLRAAAGNLGAKVVAAQFYDPAAQDFTGAVRALADYDSRRGALISQRKELERTDDKISRQALRRLESLQTIGDLPFDALMIADGGKRLQSIAALLPFYDIDPEKVRMLGTGQWDVPRLGAEPALLGAWFAAPDPRARTGFVAQYEKAYGKQPQRITTLAYDAVALAAVQARIDGAYDFSEAALTAESGFNGRDGIFRLLSSGIVERGLAVMQVRERDSKVIQSAPAHFQAYIN